MERRSVGSFTADAGQLVGYASVFDSLSENLGGFREKIDRSAFRRTLEDEAADVRALVNHDTAMVLGRRANGTLKLFTDDRGLKVGIAVPDTSYGRDLLELVRRGDVSQMSFGFVVAPNGDHWTTRDGERIRTVTDLQLVEVSVVAIPAYTDTSIALRSRDGWLAADRLRRLKLSIGISGLAAGVGR